MITVQTRQIPARRHGTSAGSDELPWADYGQFDDFADARPVVIGLMQLLKFDNDTNIALLADELRPGFTSDPHANILTADNGHQIRVIPAETTAANGESAAAGENGSGDGATEPRMRSWLGPVAILEQSTRKDMPPIRRLRLPVEPIAHPGLPLPLRVATVHQVAGDTVGSVDRLAIVDGRLIASGEVDVAAVRMRDIGLAALLESRQAAGANALITMTAVPEGSPYIQENYWQVTGVLLTSTPLWWQSTQIAIGRD